MRCAFFAGLFLICSFVAVGQSITAKRGVIDTRLWNYRESSFLLNGQWAYFPDMLGPELAQTKFVSFPHVWPSSQGVATYQMLVLLPPDAPLLAIAMPQVYSAYVLSVNDVVVAKNGRVGNSGLETKPQWLPQTIILPPSTDSLMITLTIANFHHSVGGIREPIVFGAATLLMKDQDNYLLFWWIECLILLSIGVAFVLMFIIYNRNKELIYFSMLCITWAIRSMFSNQYPFIHYFPDFSWVAMIRIEYITLYFAMIWAVLFLTQLFVYDTNRYIKYLLIGGNLLFSIFTLLAPPLWFTQLLNVFLVFATLILIYCLAIVLTALINGRPGALILTFSIVLGVNIFAYDILTYEGVFPINQLVFSVGYILMFFMNGLALLNYTAVVHNNQSGQSDKLRYDDFFKIK